MAGQDEDLTLRALLNKPKSIPVCLVGRTTNTTSDKWPQLTVSIWEQFTLNNLNAAYASILDEPLSEDIDLCLRQAPWSTDGIAICERGDINLLINRNDFLITNALRIARQILPLPSGLLCSKSSSADRSAPAKLPNVSKKLAVDHVIWLDQQPISNILVGLGKTSTNWSGSMLQNQLDRPSMQLLLPLRQLANICKEAKTQYGYIQTDKELVVCHFSYVNDNTFHALFMPIPWSAFAPDVLTTDLALWWLGVMAMTVNNAV